MWAVKYLLPALLVCGASSAPAQLFNFNLGQNAPKMGDFSGTVRLDPEKPVVGIPCAFVFTFTTKNRVDIQQVMGLPDRNIEYLSTSVEPFADGSYRLPVRFTGPLKQDLAISVGGMQTVESGNGTSFRSSYSTNFRKSLPVLKVDVSPLPEEGRPADFSGAVGKRFDLTQRLTPDHVRPGDLVTATYELSYEGYCPSNVWPSVQHLSNEFKVYEPKEISRTPTKVVWTQVLVPRTVAATNSALVSLSYYNSFLGRYEIAKAEPKALVFVSSEAASTQNTSVTVTGDAAVGKAADAVDAAARPVVLRLAPSETSPVVATLPPGSPVTELATLNGWRRVSTQKAVGWTK